MLPDQASARREEQRRAVTGAVFALNHADHNIGAMRRRSFAESLCLRAGNLDRGVEVEPELLATSRVARAHHKTIIESFRVSGDERLRKDDHFSAGARGFSDQTRRFVYACIRIERYRSRLHHSNIHGRLCHNRSHCSSYWNWFGLSDSFNGL